MRAIGAAGLPAEPLDADRAIADEHRALAMLVRREGTARGWAVGERQPELLAAWLATILPDSP